MRIPRLKAPSDHSKAFYHCVSRVVNREYLLGSEEKEHLISLMRMYETLYGLRILSYCIMSNHFHMLIEVPKRPEILPTSEELVSIVRGSLGNKKADALTEELVQTLEFHGQDGVETLKEKYFANMWDVSTFMKIVKQRFSQWYNMKNGRKGTLWEERFKSVLIQGESNALKSIAAYIDLNPERAVITDDPKDYRWKSKLGRLLTKLLERGVLPYERKLEASFTFPPKWRYYVLFTL